MVKIKKLEGQSRFDLVNLLDNRSDCIGIELGVASGNYSAKMVESGRFQRFFGVDMYADTHDTEQYKEALLNAGIFNNYCLLRMTFDDAIDLFPDECFDFVYLDGYASTGLEGGRALRAWAKKVKIGGIMAGDDYHSDFPLLQKIVNELCTQNELELLLTEGAFDDSPYGHYPSWSVIKTKNFSGETSEGYRLQGSKESEKVRAKKQRAKKFDNLSRSIFSKDTYDRLRQWNKQRRDKRHLRKEAKKASRLA